MIKLLEAFNANPNAATAARIIKHISKHPMAACAIPPATMALIEEYK